MTKKELFEKEPKKGLEWIQIMIQSKNSFLEPGNDLSNPDPILEQDQEL